MVGLLNPTRTLIFEGSPVYKIRLKDFARKAEASFYLEDDVSIPIEVVLMEAGRRALTISPAWKVNAETKTSERGEESVELTKGSQSVLIPLRFIRDIEKMHIFVP